MNKTDLAYIAGIVDGEGTIRAAPRRTEGNGCRMEVSVTSTTEWLCRWLKFNFGGCLVKRKNYNPLRHKQSWDWILGANKAKEFLYLIYPYLRIKKAQAELVIALQERIDKRKYKKGRRRLTSIDVEKDSAVIEAVRILNHKGPKSLILGT